MWSLSLSLTFICDTLRARTHNSLLPLLLPQLQQVLLLLILVLTLALILRHTFFNRDAEGTGPTHTRNFRQLCHRVACSIFPRLIFVLRNAPDHLVPDLSLVSHTEFPCPTQQATHQRSSSTSCLLDCQLLCSFGTMIRTLLLSLLAPEAASLVFYVGTGGCDGADIGCVEQPWPRSPIVAVRLDWNGTMEVIGDEVPPIATPGLPVWLTTTEGFATTNEIFQRCLFATLADKNLVYSHSSSAQHTIFSAGAAPVFAAPANFGRTLLVANYHGPDNANTSTGASVASFAINSDCSLTFVDQKNHSGSSVNPVRQGGAHAEAWPRHATWAWT